MPTSKAAVRLTRQESRERIVAAATELIRGTPYGALTVDDVMREAGAGRTIFYRHFDDLADLLMSAGREAFEGLLEAERALSEAAAHGDDDDGGRAARTGTPGGWCARGAGGLGRFTSATAR